MDLGFTYATFLMWVRYAVFWLALVVAVIALIDWAVRTRRLPVTTGLRRAIALLNDCLGHVPSTLRAERLVLAGTLVVHGIANRERAREEAGAARATPLSVFVADLVDAMVGVLAAPASPQTKRALRASTRRSA